MRVFHCDHCGHLLFFENTTCVACGHLVAYLPDLQLIGSLDRADDAVWRSPLDKASGTYRLCRNYESEQVCNWAIADGDDNPLCLSCRLTRVTPALDMPGHREAWYRLEVAKRRLLVTVFALNLPVRGRHDDAERGLTFEFKADPHDGSAPPVMTGHDNGVITINIAEADDAERERRRVSMHEPYRTLLGHMRHESGHYYWIRLVEGGPAQDRFRELFGDERRDYAEALRTHYANGASADWPDRFISAYASAHPWEDWAETWAHYLHMVDTLDTAASCGLSLRPSRADEPALSEPPPAAAGPATFDQLIDSWFPVTYALNNLNRGMGLSDAYPFVLAPPALEKLRFVHDTIAQSSSSSEPDER